MTRKASAQSYYTIRYLADPEFVETAYEAYAYFRWVDDVIDQESSGLDRPSFLARQQEIIAACYRGERLDGLLPEEQLVVDLIHNHLGEQHNGLRIYLDEMMAVMSFDAGRRGRTITGEELAEYTRSLAAAVTELLHYCIGHNDPSSQGEHRYLAVTGAHITHLLRDMVEDTAAGYYNIPQTFLSAHNLAPEDVQDEALREWVRERVALARRCFAAGRSYMAQVKNVRCRLAGYAYIGRFEIILDAIERDGFRLRPSYPERKSLKNALKVTLAALGQTIGSSVPGGRDIGSGDRVWV